MLAIRLQRTGRSGHAQFRVIVQDDRFSPKSGKVVNYVGSYNPHTKETKLNGEKIIQYLDNGAQPSERVAQLLKKEGIKLPAWVKVGEKQKRAIRHPEKLRRNRPAGAPAPVAEAAEEQPAVAVPTETPSETASPAEAPTEKPSAEEAAAEEVAAKEPVAEEKPETPAPEPTAQADQSAESDGPAA